MLVLYFDVNCPFAITLETCQPRVAQAMKCLQLLSSAISTTTNDHANITQWKKSPISYAFSFHRHKTADDIRVCIHSYTHR